MADTVKIAVCDDEKNIRSYLVSLIRKQDTECCIMEYASADEYLADGREHDLVYLDIEMGDSSTDMDGMGLARHIWGMDACRQPIIIFLDGAIEACEKLEPGKGFIRLSLKRKKQFLLLEVENSFDGNMPVREGGSLPSTTKQSTLPGIITEHGIGLENVRDMAERYFGRVNIKVKGDVFHVTVMLQQEVKTKANR